MRRDGSINAFIVDKVFVYTTTFLDVLTSYTPLMAVFLTTLVAKRAYAPVRRGPATTLHNYVIEFSAARSKPISPWIYKNTNSFTLF